MCLCESRSPQNIHRSVWRRVRCDIPPWSQRNVYLNARPHLDAVNLTGWFHLVFSSSCVAK